MQWRRDIVPMGCLMPSMKQFVTDQHIPALAATKQASGDLWMFYTYPVPNGRAIHYTVLAADTAGASVKQSNVQIAIENKLVADVDMSPLACITFLNEVHVYYIERNTRLIKAAWLRKGKWEDGFINKKNYKASLDSALYATTGGTGEQNKSSISLLFMDHDNGDVLTEAFFVEGSGWDKRVVPAP